MKFSYQFIAATLAAATFSISAAAADIKTVRVGTQGDNAGTSYLDANGKLTGYEVEVLRAIDDLLPEYQFEFKPMDFATLFVSLSTNKVDLINSNLKHSAEREKQFLFTKNDFYRTPYKLVVKGDETAITSFADLNGKKIAVLGTGLQSKVLSNHIEKLNLKTEIIPSKSNTEIVALLTQGRADAIFLPEHQVNVFNRYRDANLKTIGKGLIPEGKTPETFGAHFLLQKKDTELRDKIDAALAQIKENGTLARLSVEWFGQDFTGNYEIEP